MGAVTFAMTFTSIAPRMTRYIPVRPHPPQLAFLMLAHREALYGGAAGGGKSAALLMAALQYVDVPGYSAILFRRSYTDLSLPGALMDRAHEWLGGTDAHWNDQTKTWAIPKGGTVTFGYLASPNDKFRYQSAEFQFIGFDELTQFPELDYRYLFSRLRRLSTAEVPLRMRAASNPGGIGHDWVKQRFLTERPPDRAFIPAKLQDNLSLDAEQYTKSLSELDPITRQQLLNGDWTARHGGSKFRREWFDTVDIAPPESRFIRFWDLAATFPEAGEDPDWTAGVKLGLHPNGSFYVADVQRFRETPHVVEAKIKRTAEVDGVGCAVRMEQEPGASGVMTIDHYARQVLLGYDFRGVKTTGAKEERANPVSAAAERKQIKIVRANWRTAFLDEIEAFPLGSHDDQVDALSGAYQELAFSTRNLLQWVR
jgi:predicted phage terminase large subunit-like protein